jgi:hypothetical protein
MHTSPFTNMDSENNDYSDSVIRRTTQTILSLLQQSIAVSRSSFPVDYNHGTLSSGNAFDYSAAIDFFTTIISVIRADHNLTAAGPGLESTSSPVSLVGSLAQSIGTDLRAGIVSALWQAMCARCSAEQSKLVPKAVESDSPEGSSAMSASASLIDADSVVNGLEGALQVWRVGCFEAAVFGSHAATAKSTATPSDTVRVPAPAPVSAAIGILRHEEKFAYVWETSHSGTIPSDGGSSCAEPLIRILEALCAGGEVQQCTRSADVALSIATSAWDDLAGFCRNSPLTSQILADSYNNNSSPIVHDGIAANVLATVVQGGGIGSVEYEGISTFVLRLLYACLLNGELCLGACRILRDHTIQQPSDSKMSTSVDEGFGAVQVFVSCARRRLNLHEDTKAGADSGVLGPISSSPSSEDELLALINSFST